MNRDTHVLIAGAGIGGLCLALALLRQGFRVTVIEQARALAPVGAGLTLSEGAVRCFDLWGVADAIEPLLASNIATPTLHYRTGERLGPVVTAAAVAAHRGGFLHRAELHDALAAAVRALDPQAIQLGRGVAAFHQDAAGVTVRLSDGASVRGDLLVGADGVRSVVRAGLFGDDAPLFTGRVAYRFLLPIEEARPYLGGRPSAVYVGPSRLINRYLVCGGQVLNVVGLARSETWLAEGWSNPATPDEMLAEFAGWHPDIEGLIARAPPDKLIRWGIFERPPRAVWSRGRVTLLGDAAHPMQPFLGLGAGMAIEDAAILGRALGELDDVDSAFAAYQRVRAPRAAAVAEASRRQGEVFDAFDPEDYPPRGAPEGFVLGRFDPAEVGLRE